MKTWKLVVLLVAAVLFYGYVQHLTHDPRHVAFMQADTENAEQLDRVMKTFLDKSEAEGHIDMDEFGRLLTPFVLRAGQLKRNYDSGLMPDDTTK